MNLALKRWIRFTVVLVLVLVLCWQNSNDSENLTNLIYNIIRDFAEYFGKATTYSAKSYLLIRKIGHAVAFAIMGFFSHTAIAATAEDFQSAMICSFIFNPAIGIIAEIGQGYALGRSPCIKDAVINICGCLIGIGIAVIYVAIRDEKLRDKGYHEE